MFEGLRGWIMGFDFTGWMGFFLYWLPLSLCAYGYTVRTWMNYQADVAARSSEVIYIPTDTIGTVVGRGLVSVLPVANIWAASFDVAPRLFSSFFGWLGRVFDQPLVPKKKG